MQDAFALAGMRDLGMKLDAVETARIVGHAGHRCTVRAGDDPETIRQCRYAVTVTHPHVQQAVTLHAGVVLDIRQQAGMAAGTHLCIAVFMMIRVFHATAELCRHGLHTVADAQHRHTGIEHHGRHLRGGITGDRFRAAGEDEAARTELFDLGRIAIVRPDFAIDALFAHATCNQLGVL